MVAAPERPAPLPHLAPGPLWASTMPPPFQGSAPMPMRPAMAFGAAGSPWGVMPQGMMHQPRGMPMPFQHHSFWPF